VPEDVYGEGADPDFRRRLAGVAADVRTRRAVIVLFFDGKSWPDPEAIVAQERLAIVARLPEGLVIAARPDA